MPKALEAKLTAEAAKKGLTGKRANALIFGTMQKTTNWTPGAKGPFHGKTASGQITKKVAE